MIKGKILVEHIKKWCSDGQLPVDEENINRFLALRGLSLTKNDLMKVYRVLLEPPRDPNEMYIDSDEDKPYTTDPVTVRVRKSVKYWVPAKSNPKFVISKPRTLGTDPYLPEIYAATPNALSQHLIDQHNEWVLKQKAKEVEMLQTRQEQQRAIAQEQAQAGTSKTKKIIIMRNY